MAVKLALLFVTVFLVFQFARWGEANPRVARETETSSSKDAAKAIDDAFNSLSTGVTDLIGKIKGNELFRNLTTVLENFGQTVQESGKELVSKIQKAAN